MLSIGSKGWTVIDGGSGRGWCAVSLQLRGARPRVLAAAEEVAVDAAADEAGPLRTLLGRLGRASRGLPQLVTLPRSAYRLRVMPEPAVPAREMLTSLRWAISAEVDSPTEDVDLAWMRIPTEEHLPSKPRQIYAVMAPREAMSMRLNAWREAGVRPKVVDIRETALRNIAGLLEKPGEGALLVNVEDDGIGMVFTHQGSLYLDRFIEMPVAELIAGTADARRAPLERIAQQIVRSIDVVGRSFPFMALKRVVVAPEPPGLGLLQHLREQMPLPVEALDLQRLFDFENVPELARSPALQCRALVALGAALRNKATA